MAGVVAIFEGRPGVERGQQACIRQVALEVGENVYEEVASLSMLEGGSPDGASGPSAGSDPGIPALPILPSCGASEG